jgi:hypothetical protein
LVIQLATVFSDPFSSMRTGNGSKMEKTDSMCYFFSGNRAAGAG